MDQLSVCVWSDRPDLTSGFTNATNPFIYAFLGRGWKVSVMGCSGGGEMVKNFPCPVEVPNKFDPEGVSGFSRWMIRENPDVLFIVRDPGTLSKWIFSRSNGPSGDCGIEQLLERRQTDLPWLKPFKVIAYVPIEGYPITPFFGDAIRFIQSTGGQVVFYTEKSAQLAKRDFPHLETQDFVWHGLDHAPFQPYKPEDRILLRKMLGLDDYFIIGTVGVNKRTKGLPQVLYTAKELKRMGVEKVLFYLHSALEDPVLEGYNIVHLANHPDYDVAEMIQPNPRLFGMQNQGKSVLHGVPVRNDNTIEWLMQLYQDNGNSYPDDPEIRSHLMAHYSYIDLLNILDLYFDPSEIEGWGLPVGEAMACGIPVLGVGDNHVRDEVYGDARQRIEPLDPELWTTWSTGARLTNFDPRDAAHTILYLMENPQRRVELAYAGFMHSKKYRWRESADKMIKIIEGVL